MEKIEWLPAIGDLVTHRHSNCMFIVTEYDTATHRYKIDSNTRSHTVSLLFMRKVCRPYWVSTNVVVRHGNGLWQVNKVTLLKTLDVTVQVAETNGAVTNKHADYLATKKEHQAWKRNS